jgi:hypothetical protein
MQQAEKCGSPWVGVNPPMETGKIAQSDRHINTIWSPVPTWVISKGQSTEGEVVGD